MPETIVLLQLEHANIARLLAVLEDQAGRLQSNGSGDLALVASALEYFRDYPDRCHHPKEDRVFRRLAERDPARAREVGDLLADHESVARMTETMIQRVRTARTRGADAEFILRLREFIKVYREHLLAEEQHFFPAAVSCLTPDDWAAIDFDVFDREDPLFDDVTEERFRRLRQNIQNAAPQRRKET